MMNRTTTRTPTQRWEINEPAAPPARRQGWSRAAPGPARGLADPAPVTALGLGPAWRQAAQAGQLGDESHLHPDVRPVLAGARRADLRDPGRRLYDGLLEV